MFDVIIVGAGVTGCSIARELSKYNLKTCVLERSSDVAMGTTKANSAIIHAGYDPVPGTLKAKLDSKGNSMFDKLAKDLDFPFKRNGSLVLSFSENDQDKLEALVEKGKANGVPNLQILNREQLLKMEPNLSEHVVAGMYAPTGGIVCPYEYTIALAENAFLNGVEFKFDSEVKSIEKSDNKFILKTTSGDVYECKLVVNAAGLYADELNNMVSKNKIKIIPRRGEYCVCDKVVGNMATATLFQLPTKLGKGILVSPTVDGNLIIGPNAVDQEDKDDLTTTQEGLDDILSKAAMTIKNVPVRQVITSFSGLRARPVTEDFIIGETEDVENFVNAAGIESPGLSSSPAIGQMVREIVVNKLSPKENKKFNPRREGIPKFREMSNDERNELIAEDPSYGKIICRCETVTEGEIINSIRRPLGAKTLDGVKRRTRAGMGRCQSGFCSTRIVDILSKELGVSYTEITKFGGESSILLGKNKEV